MVRCKLLLVMLALAAVQSVLPGATAHARLWRVERDGSGDYSTIQPAIDAAAPGDTIQLGPGRYTETTTTSFPGFTVQSHAVVEKGPLTFLARVPGQAIIGPTERHDVGLGPHGISVSATSAGIMVEGLVIENVFDCLYAQQAATVRNCTLRGSFNGITAFGVDGLNVEASTLGANDGGLIVSQGCRNVTVTKCAFLQNIYHGAAFIQTSNAVVDSCTFVGGGQGITFQQGSSGTMRNSTVTNAIQVGVYVDLSAVAAIHKCRIYGGGWTIATLGRSSVFVTDSVISGGSYATVYFSAYASAQLHHNHILKGVGYSAQAESYISQPVITLDLSDNYWGTTSTDSVAGWIHDGGDDPSIKAIIDFDPILLTPVAVLQTSLGALKARFRPE